MSDAMQHGMHRTGRSVFDLLVMHTDLALTPQYTQTLKDTSAARHPPAPRGRGRGEHTFLRDRRSAREVSRTSQRATTQL